MAVEICRGRMFTGVHSVLIGMFKNQKVPRDRKPAPPLPLCALVPWERCVLMSNCTVFVLSHVVDDNSQVHSLQ